jgi:hypothetical protein
MKQARALHNRRALFVWEEAASMRYVKLRITGFECQVSFVIRCALSDLPKKLRPAIVMPELVSVFDNNLMSLPINVDTTSIQQI